MKFYRILFLLSTILFYSNQGYCQSDRELKLAGSLAKSGQYEAALQIYLNHYQSGSRTPTVVNGIKNAYENLGDWNSLIIFLNEIIESNPKNFNYSIDLGTAYFRDQQTEKALETWQRVYAHRPPNLMRYRLVASAMVKVRLFDEAIAVYHEAMNVIPNQQAIYLDMGTLYRAQLNYEKATLSYLKYYAHYKKKYSYIQSLIISMTRDDEATDRILKALEQFMDGRDVDSQLKQLQAGLYIKKKEFDKAFNIYSSLDKPESNHQFLLKFAREAEVNHAHQFAIKALNRVKATTKSKKSLNIINFDLARNYFRMGKQNKHEPDVQQALLLIDEIEDVSTARNPYYQGLELSGDIYRFYYQDYDQAINAYSSFLKKRQRGTMADRIRLKLGRTYFMKNDLDESATFYREVERGKEKTLARYYLAQLEYFNGNFKIALDAYQNLLNSISMNDSLANNILDYVFQISQNRQDSLLLSTFAQAERLNEQQKISEAAEHYSSLVMADFGLGLEAGIRSAKLHLSLEEFDKSVNILTELLTLFQGEPRMDEVLYLLGNVSRELNNPAQALDYYQQLLAGYPDSFFLEEAREEAREVMAVLKEEATP